MVVPVGDESGQKMMRLTKMPDGSMSEEVLGNFSFVPMLEGKKQ
jgi:protein-L-isoaspartate(D-aspartate) O-methyltransferase